MRESEILSNAFWRTVPFSYVPSFQLCTLIQVCTLTQVCTLIQVCALSYVPSLIAIQLCTLLQPMYSPFKKKTCFKKYKWMKIIARMKIQFEWESLVAIACLFRILRFSLRRWNYYGSAAYAQGVTFCSSSHELGQLSPVHFTKYTCRPFWTLHSKRWSPGNHVWLSVVRVHGSLHLCYTCSSPFFQTHQSSRARFLSLIET